MILSKKQVHSLILPYLLLLPCAAAMFIAFSPFVLEKIIGTPHSALELLQAYRTYYDIITYCFYALIAFLFLMAFWIILAIARLKDEIFTRYQFSSIKRISKVLGLILFPCVIILLGFLISYKMFEEENIAQLIQQVNEDIQQVESGQLEDNIVYFNKNRQEKSSLPGPYSDGMPTSVTSYRAISANDSKDGWQTFYIPDFLNFKLDPKLAFNDLLSIRENKKRAQAYQINFTTNFRLITNIQAVSANES